MLLANIAYALFARYPIQTYKKQQATRIDLVACCFSGGDKRDRTADLLNAIQALSQLSYTPMVVEPLTFLGFRVIQLPCCAGHFTDRAYSQLSHTPPNTTRFPQRKRNHSRFCGICQHFFSFIFLHTIRPRRPILVSGRACGARSRLVQALTDHLQQEGQGWISIVPPPGERMAGQRHSNQRDKAHHSLGHVLQIVREGAYPNAAGHQHQYAGHVVGLGRHLRHESSLRRHFPHDAVAGQGRSARHDHKAFIPQVLHTQAVHPGQGRVHRHHRALPVPPEDDGLSVLRRQGIAGIDDSVNLSHRQRAKQVGVAPLVEGDVDLGAGLGHTLIDLHRAGVKIVPQNPDVDVAPEALLGQPGRVHSLAEVVQDAGTLPGKGPACRGEGHAAGAAVEKLDAQLLFQGGDRPAQGRLGDEQVVRGLGEVQPLGQHQEALHLIQRHFATSSRISPWQYTTIRHFPQASIRFLHSRYN